MNDVELIIIVLCRIPPGGHVSVERHKVGSVPDEGLQLAILELGVEVKNVLGVLGDGVIHVVGLGVVHEALLEVLEAEVGGVVTEHPVGHGLLVEIVLGLKGCGLLHHSDVVLEVVLSHHFAVPGGDEMEGLFPHVPTCTCHFHLHVLKVSLDLA